MMTLTPATPITATPPRPDVTDQLAAFFASTDVAFTREDGSFVFALQGRDVLVSTAPGLVRLFVPLLENIEEVEAREAIALLEGAAPLPDEYADVAAYIVDKASQTAGLNLLLAMPRTFSAAALGDACELIVEVSAALARQAAGA
jgi:hypothetical protein